jgi:hypothetical protein
LADAASRLETIGRQNQWADAGSALAQLEEAVAEAVPFLRELAAHT